MPRPWQVRSARLPDVSDAPPTLSAEGLVARYPGRPETALDGVSLHVPSAGRLLLVGRNGAGKSTLLRIFAGLLRPSRGEASIGGLPPSAARGGVGYLGHHTYLYDELTAMENLRLYGALYGVASPGNRARSLLGKLELEHRADSRVGTLSRGQQQRVGLARALMHDPDVLLLDEPDTGLDTAAVGILGRLLEDDPRTVVLATHRLELGVRLCTRAALLSEGRVAVTVDRLTPGSLTLLQEQLESADAVK